VNGRRAVFTLVDPHPDDDLAWASASGTWADSVELSDVEILFGGVDIDGGQS